MLKRFSVALFLLATNNLQSAIKYEGSHYEILGVSLKASTEQIRESYLKWSAKFNPDRVKVRWQEKMRERIEKAKNNPEELKQIRKIIDVQVTRATELFQEIGNAYEILSDPIKRRDYDKSLRKKSGATESHYDILGISPKATDDQIRKAYLKLSLEFHPDKVKARWEEKMRERIEKAKNNPEELKQIRKIINIQVTRATELFQEIGNAYEILSDPKKKHDYDESLRKKSARSP